MMSLLVRAHFEKTGSYDNFPYSDKVSREEFFKLLGYEKDASLSSYERFKFRKLSSQGSSKKLQEIFKVSSKSDLVKVLTHFNCLTERGNVRPVKKGDETLEQLARLLSAYLLENEEKELWTKNESVNFSDYMRGVKVRLTKKNLEDTINSDSFIQALQLVLPEFRYKKECTPTISQGIFFIPYKSMMSKVEEIVRLAVYHSLINILDVPDQVYFAFKSNITVYQLMNDSDYLKIIDWSHSLGMTLSEVIEKCGFKYVDRIKYFEDHKIIPYLIGEDKYLIYSSKSNTIDDYVILNGNQVSNLMARGSLKTLEWDENGRVHVYLSGRKYLDEMYSNAVNLDIAEKDFSGGG